jgi:phosphoserine phosphatase RsbU/P
MPVTPLNPWPWRIRVGLWVCLVVSLGLTLLCTCNHRNRRSQLEQAAFDHAAAEAAKAAAEISRVFGSVRTITNHIASDLSDGTLAYADIDRRLRAELGARLDIHGIAITFQPYVYNPALRLYQYYLSRGDDNKIAVLDWDHRPLQHGAVWNEPFLATGAGRVLIEYGVPFFRQGASQEPAGVVTMDYSLQGMRDLTAALQLGENGYGYVISGNGVFLSHPPWNAPGDL